MANEPEVNADRTSHQRNVIEIDFAGILIGSAYLTLHPVSPSLRTLYLHASPRLSIESVTLSSPTVVEPLLPAPATFVLCDAFQPLPVREPPIDVRSHPEIKRKVWAASSEAEEGELAISVSGGWVRVIQAVEGEHSLAPIEVRIDYRLALGAEIVDGIRFLNDDVPHMYLSPTTCDSARIWTPCVDSLWERCTWELEFIVPRYLRDEEQRPVTVVSSGELMEQTIHPHSPHKAIFYYLQTNATSVQHIGFAAGPFEMHEITSALKPILGFCLPGESDSLLNTTAFLPAAMTYYSTEFGSYPFSDFKVVFVADSPETFPAATLAICCRDLLSPANVIDQAIVTRQILSLVLSQQWVGVNIIQRAICDTWLIHGLAIYLQSLFLRHLLGNNEYRFRLKKDIDRCCRLDRGEQTPICVPGALSPPANISFVNLKAPLVLHILDRHIVKAGTSLGLTRVIPRIFLSALSDELPGNTLSTQAFFRTCRRTSGLDLQTFQDQWVYGSGCPVLQLQANFSRKKFVVELEVTQVVPAMDALDKALPKAQAVFAARRPVSLFEGSLTVRIHEADGAPFEHLVDVKNVTKVFALPFNTKYKRTRRSGHIAARFSELQADLAAEDDADEAQLRVADRGDLFTYSPWEDDEERLRWRVSDWSDQEADTMLNELGGYEWIGIDPECEWIASFEFKQNAWYWVSQLQGDRDVTAQLDAIYNMALYPSPVVASELARTVLVTNYFYRVRMEAAKALVACCTPQCDYIGLFLLLKLYQHMFCLPADGGELEANFNFRPNHFADVAAYFMKKTLLGALADLRDIKTMTSWRSVRRMLLNVLRANDNTVNPMSDAIWLATVITAVGNAFSIPFEREETDLDLLRQATEAVDRAMTMDRLVPSFQNVVTEAALRTQAKFVLAGHRTNDPRLFLAYTRDGNYVRVRQAALDCLLICRPPGRSFNLDNYWVRMVRQDSSLRLRRHIGRAMCNSVLLSLALGEVNGAFDGPLAVSDTNIESQQALDQRAEARDTVIVRAVRKEFSKKSDLRQSVQDTLLHTFTRQDEVVRLALLKFAEITVASSAEPIAGNVITLLTPAVDKPSIVTPRIRLSLGGDVKNDRLTQGLPIIDGIESGPVTLIQKPGSKKRDRPVPKSLSKGLTDSDFAAISNALEKLIADKTSIYFRVPVDPVRDAAPDYFVIVKYPMDLSTAQAKLDNGMYTSRDEFVADVRMIISNCYSYNGQASPVRKTGEAFEASFNTILARTEATLSRSAAHSIPSRPDIPVLHSADLSTDQPSIRPPVGPLKLNIRSTAAPSVSHQLYIPIVPPMAPPPLPPSRRPQASTSGVTMIPDAGNRKRKGSTKTTSAIDAALGAEVDAMSYGQLLGDVEEHSEPVPKRVKLPVKRSSPNKTSRPVAGAPSISSETIHPTVITSYRNIPPVDLPPTAHNTTLVRRKRVRVLLNVLMRDPNAAFFLHPVDPALVGAPTYWDEIKQPMDLGTVFKNLEGKKYKTMGQVAYDIELVFQNCRQFNNPGDDVNAAANALEVTYWKEWPRACQPRMTPEEKKAMQALLSKILKDERSVLFRDPVDPVALNIPSYFDIIPQEDARDLSTIKRQLDNGDLTYARQVDDDVQLMLDNARVFNGEGFVSDAADSFGDWWIEQRAKID